MYSGTVRKLVKKMTPGQREKLQESIELGRTTVYLLGREAHLNLPLLRFIQAELKGDKPKLLEKRRTGHRNGKCRVIRKGGKVTQ